MKTYTFISDGGHGWLRVPMTELTELDFVPSRYSYHEGVWAYLEEDCDAPAFLHVQQDDRQIESEHHEGRCYVRAFAQFPKPDRQTTHRAKYREMYGRDPWWNTDDDE